MNDFSDIFYQYENHELLIDLYGRTLEPLMFKYAELLCEMTNINESNRLKSFFKAGEYLKRKKRADKNLDSMERKINQFKWIVAQMNSGVDFFGVQEFDKKMLQALMQVADINTIIQNSKPEERQYIRMPTTGFIYKDHKKMDVAILYNKDKWEPVGDSISLGKKQFCIGQEFQSKSDPSRSIYVASVHLQSGSKKRQKRRDQVNEMKDILQKDNLVICMDANDTDGAALMSATDTNGRILTIDGDKDVKINQGGKEDLPNCIPNKSTCFSLSDMSKTKSLNYHSKNVILHLKKRISIKLFQT